MRSLFSYTDESKIILPNEFSSVVEESLHVLSETGTIDWEASFKKAVDYHNNSLIINGTEIVVTRQERDKLRQAIASQSVELMDLKEALKTKRTSDTLDADDKPGTSQNGSGEPDSKKAKRNSKARLPHYPLVFNKRPDGNAKEPVVRIS